MAAISGWAIERLGKHHQRSAFDCGKPPLTAWIKQHAGQAEDRDLARVYVAVTPGDASVLGYYSLSACQVRHGTLPADHAKGLPPRMDTPAALIGKLAVDLPMRGKGLGGHLLVDALRRCLALGDRLGIQAVVVDAIDDEARGFYLHQGFGGLLDDPRRLFLTMRVIRKLGLAATTD